MFEPFCLFQYLLVRPGACPSGALRGARMTFHAYIRLLARDKRSSLFLWRVIEEENKVWWNRNHCEDSQNSLRQSYAHS